jgi:N-acetyltransferase
VIVGPVAATDRHELFAVAADPEIWPPHPVTNRHTEPVFRVFFDSAIASSLAFSFIDRQRGKIV